MYTIGRNDIIYINSHIYSNNIIKKNGGNDIMGSELIFSDTVHQFLQVLPLSHMNYNVASQTRLGYKLTA